MARLNPTQRRTARIFKGIGSSHLIDKALIEAGLVEAELGNPNYGDRDSVGSLQERGHYGSVSRRLNRRAAARRFTNEAEALLRKGFKGSAGQLAQAVQRSGHPERYDQRSREAESILRSTGGVSTNMPGSSLRQAVATRTLELPAIQNTPQPSVQPINSAALAGVDLGDPRPEQTRTAFQQPTPPQPQPTTVKIEEQVPASSVRRAARDRRGTGSEKKGLVGIGRLAQSMGLHVGENPHFGGVHPVHVKGSYHYQGRAIDVSGDPAKMQRFARVVQQRYGKSLKELFWNGPGARNIKNGKRVGKGFVSGHTDHVHVAE